MERKCLFIKYNKVMKCIVIKEFNDMKHDCIRRRPGDVYNDRTIRVHELISKGFVQVAEDGKEQETAGTGEQTEGD